MTVRRVMGIETEYGISVPGHPNANAMLTSSQVVNAYAAELGVAVIRVSVRDQTSRWGSCSSTGVLSFSWRLILAPPYVLEYLAAHEVAHLVEMNHSARFWRVVNRLIPDHRMAKAWLDAHGADLHRYGLPDAPCHRQA